MTDVNAWLYKKINRGIFCKQVGNAKTHNHLSSVVPGGLPQT